MQSADVRAALEVAEEIAEIIDELPEETFAKAADFFEGVGERAEAIADTIRSRETVSDAQRGALDNMLRGVKKWVHDDD